MGGIVSRTRESEGRRERAGGHHVGGLLALRGVGGGDGVDNGLGFFLANLCTGFIWLAIIQLLGLAALLAPSVRRTLVVVHHVPQVVSTGVMRLAHAHRVVRQIDITVVAC